MAKPMMQNGEHDKSATSINMSQDERSIATLSGVALLIIAVWNPKKYGLLLGPLGGSLLYQGLMGHSYIYQLLGRNSAVHSRNAAISVPHEQGFRVVHKVTVDRPVDKVYDFWRDFANLPQFMKHVEAVTINGPTQSHWRVSGPLGVGVEWDAEIVNEEENRVIGWRTLENPYVDHAGSVRFRSVGDNRTEVEVDIEYLPIGGKFGATMAGILGKTPQRQVWEDLHRFKRHMEAMPS